jgi:hypothetical protein
MHDDAAVCSPFAHSVSPFGCHLKVELSTPSFTDLVDGGFDFFVCHIRKNKS